MAMDMTGGLRDFVRKSSALGSDVSKHEITLEVTQGLHAGAKLELSEPIYTIGSDTDADIALSDPEVAPAHVRLRKKGSLIEIEAIGGSVQFADGRLLQQGHGRICGLPLEFTLGLAKVLVSGASPSPRPAAFPKPTLVVAGIVVAALFVVASGLSLAHSGRIPGHGSTLALASDRRQLEMVAPRSDVLTTSAVNISGDPEGQLRVKLEEANLHTLTVKRVQDRLLVSGVIPDQQAEAWAKTQSWFDQTYGDHILLAADVKAKQGGSVPRFSLQAIWYGDRPYVITADGARYYEGGLLRDGWTITQIGERQLLLSKGSSTVAFNYQ